MLYLKLFLVFSGYGIRLWVVLHNPGFNLLVTPPKTIYQGGLYRYIRHPAYLGSLMMLGGIFALCSGWIGALPPWIVLLVLLTHTARHEEMMLAEKFPEYKEYMTRTGMLLPKLRRGKPWQIHTQIQ